MINGKQGRMLMSLLDKPLNKIRIDRLVELEDLNRKLITNPQEVLEKTKKHFQQQFRIRNFQSHKIRNRWEKIYQPKEEIDKIWYKQLNQDITEEEWLEMLSELKNNTASGVLGITYMLIKAASNQTQNIFRKLAEICIKTELIPKNGKCHKFIQYQKT